MSEQRKPVASVVHNGPLIVEGTVPVTRLDRADRGWALTPALGAADVVVLCRCGASSRLPFCDREPPYACFEEDEPSDAPVKPFEWDLPDGSSPMVALKPNGPIRVAGGLPVRDGSTGSVVDPGDRVSLCRCGASRSQPFCDGTHKVVGYREPR
jgi:CDGSH-type Zn-finger protein